MLKKIALFALTATPYAFSGQPPKNTLKPGQSFELQESTQNKINTLADYLAQDCMDTLRIYRNSEPGRLAETIVNKDVNQGTQLLLGSLFIQLEKLQSEMKALKEQNELLIKLVAQNQASQSGAAAQSSQTASQANPPANASAKK